MSIARRLPQLFTLLVATLLLSTGTRAQDGGIDASLLAGMRARSIGPAGMSGRVAAIDAVMTAPRTVYVGAATGGLWRSDDLGTTWRPIFDDQPVAAIGAVTIDQSSPDTVWIGTGEGNPRNSVSVGNGIYRTTDGGSSWEHLGLEDTERIHRVILHPRDSNVVWVCAMGRAWGENEQRGVYRSDDGGASWQKILGVDEKTGCADLVADPANPRALLAAMWQFRRWPHYFESGGPGSGLYRTTDGGDTWQRAGTLDGMPEGDLGRIGLAYAASEPRIAYALVEAKESALLRSEDGGRTWRTVNSDPNVSPRPFYFGDIRVDPERPDRVYRLAGSLDVSNDGGKSFQTLAGFGALHPDHHELWIHPDDAELLISGNDGGVGISHDRGQSWDFVRNLPLAQYYHVRVDDDVPYNIYGGLQDNGSWRGPSAVWERGFGGGIRNFHWTMVDFGDGFDTAPDPESSRQGYAMSQGGYLSRWNLDLGGSKSIRPDGPDDEVLRFNWNAGFAQDPFDAGTIYYGSQFLHKSSDRGESWSRISADLTSDNEEWQLQAESGGLTHDVTAAENYTTIITVAPSPREPGVLWVGTDDGRVQVSRDSGDNWQSIEAGAEGVPANTWVPHITPSRHRDGEAFVVFDNHRRSDWEPYVFRVRDYGLSWERIADGDDVRGYALKVEQDPVDEDLLFLGTEFGLWVSVDGAGSWFQWTHGVPTVSVMDLVIQPRGHDLVIGTHGRALFVLDDIAPLRGLDAPTLASNIHLFAIADAQQYRAGASPGELMPGSTEFRGENRPYGALITFVLNADELPHPDGELERERLETQRLERAARGEQSEETAPPAAAAPEGMPGRLRPGKKAKIEVLQGDEVIRTFEATVHSGVNRVVWDLRQDAFERPGRDEFAAFFGGGGAEVLPGTYTVHVRYGKEDDEVAADASVTVLGDPRLRIPSGDRQANHDAVLQVGALQEVIAQAVARIGDLRADVSSIQKKQAAAEAAAEEKSDDGAEDAEGENAIGEQATALLERLRELEAKLWTPPDTKGIVSRDRALDQVGNVLQSLQSSWERPNPTQQVYVRQVEELVRGLVEELNEISAGPVTELRQAVRDAGIELLAESSPLAIE